MRIFCQCLFPFTFLAFLLGTTARSQEPILKQNDAVVIGGVRQDIGYTFALFCSTRKRVAELHLALIVAESDGTITDPAKIAVSVEAIAKLKEEILEMNNHLASLRKFLNRDLQTSSKIEKLNETFVVIIKNAVKTSEEMKEGTPNVMGEGLR